MTEQEKEAVEAKIDTETESEVEAEAEEKKELEELQEALEEAQAQADEYLDGWQRARAELSNYKKRQEAERSKMRERANATLLRKLLPILDDFERAIATMPAGLSQLTWSEGFFLIKHKLDAILETENVESIKAEGQMFDPYYHEAVTYEEAPNYEEGQIIDEVQRGYMLGEHVLRPALVRVAKAPSTPPEEENENDTTENNDLSRSNSQ